jgi:hypothetical protein
MVFRLKKGLVQGTQLANDSLMTFSRLSCFQEILDDHAQVNYATSWFYAD